MKGFKDEKSKHLAPAAGRPAPGARIKVRHRTAYRCLLFLFGLVLSSYILSCSGKDSKKSSDPAPGGECGECLSVQTPRVCTKRGTMRNACLAICRGVKIECYQACPCPAPKSK